MQGKIALITGAAGGIGLAIAQRYAAEGARVVLTDNQAELGERETRALADAGHDVRFLNLDAGDEAGVEAVVAQVEAEVGPIDIVVCSAGIARATGVFYEAETADFEAVLRVNLIGPYLMGKAVAKRMVAEGRTGSIIHISSVGSVLGVAESYAYCTSKAGLGMLTKTMALALADKGVRVNAIGPGPVETPLTSHLPEAARRSMLSRTPMGRFGDAAEIAGIAVFLASEDASYITGQTIYADGGRLALNYVVDVKLSS